MPKEIIRKSTDVYGTDEDPYIPAIVVHWGRDLDVQVASVNLANEGSFDMTEKPYGWHVDLDRDLINKLIKTLRKARDQAYGADE